MTTQPKEGDTKMVPEGTVVSLRKQFSEKEKRLKEELRESKATLAEVQAQLRVAKLNADDDEAVKEVKDYLIKEEQKLITDRAKVEQDSASLEEERQEREKEVRVQALASEHLVDVNAIKDAEDPEKEALRLKAERLTQEKAELESKAPPESIYESIPAGSVKKQPRDMTAAEFDEHVKIEKHKALSKT